MRIGETARKQNTCNAHAIASIDDLCDNVNKHKLLLLIDKFSLLKYNQRAFMFASEISNMIHHDHHRISITETA